MPKSVLRAFLIVEFLIALQVVFTVWSEVGGQYHIDLMFWPWKLGVSFIAATLIVAITASVIRAPGDGVGSLPRKVWIYAAMLFATLAVAGIVTYYYHVNEPSDDEEDAPQDQPAHYQTRQAFWPRTIG
jgi:hypothetical protein